MDWKNCKNEDYYNLLFRWLYCIYYDVNFVGSFYYKEVKLIIQQGDIEYWFLYLFRKFYEVFFEIGIWFLINI